MKTSAVGRALIERREGRRLAAYRDTRGILTIGVGHTGRMSPPVVTAGMTISEGQCDALLAGDLVPIEKVLRGALKGPVSQNEFDAMASLGFNIGAAGLRRSAVVRKLNLGDVDGAADAFLAWDRPAVLIPRRAAEKAQFLTPDSAAAAVRAQTLAARAAATKAKAKATEKGGTILVAAGAASAAVPYVAQARHPAAALIVGGVVIAMGLAAALVAIFAHRKAAALAANAGRQARAAEAAPPSTVTTLAR